MVQKFSRKTGLISPAMLVSKPQIKSLTAEILSMCQNDTCVLVLLNPDCLTQPGQPFLVLEARLKRNLTLMTRCLGNVIGTYGQGVTPQMILEDLQAIGIITK